MPAQSPINLIRGEQSWDKLTEPLPSLLVTRVMDVPHCLERLRKIYFHEPLCGCSASLRINNRKVHLDGSTVKRYYRAESIIRTSPRQLYGES
jgi:hypothetical protein